MTKTRAKAIKLYWNIAKERCPFHEKEMVNGFLEGFIDCAEYLFLQIAELEKENAELKEKWLQATDEGTSWAHRKSLERENAKLKGELTKAKELLRQLVNIEYAVNIPKDKIISLRVKVEQFLNSEVEK